MNSSYSTKYDQIKDDVLSALEEGFKEGLKAGVRDGILNGIKEWVDLGYPKVKKAKLLDLDEIMRDVASETLENLAKSRTKDEVCPILREELQKQCDHLLHKLRSEDRIKTAKDATDILKNLKMEDLADKKMKELSGEAKKALPSNMVATSLFDGLYKALWGCTKESIKICRKRAVEAAAARDVQI